MVVNPLESPWIKERYERLYGTFRNSQFTTKDAARELGGEDERTVRVFLSEMNRAGLIGKERDPGDRRRVRYRFLPAAESLTYEVSLNDSPRCRRIRSPASTDRAASGIFPDDFDDLEGFLTYQTEIFDLMAAFRIRTLEDLHDFFFLLTAGKIMNLVEDSGYEVDITADDILEGRHAPLEELIEVATEEGLFAGFWSAGDREEVRAFCARMRQRFDSREGMEFAQDLFLEGEFPAFVDLFLSTGRYDLDRYFDPDLFLHLYTTCYPIVRDTLPHAPPEVLDLLVRLVNPQPGESLCDPAGCDFIPLLQAYRHVQAQEREIPTTSLIYGQIFTGDPDLAPGEALWYRLYACYRVLCNTPDATIGVTTGNALLAAPFRELTDLQETAFDCVVSAPPWGLGGYGKERLKKTDTWWRRFPWGVPSGRSADWAFVQVAVSLAGDGGRSGVVIDRSALNREGEDERIRAAIIEENLIDCVILLPEQIYTKTQFQTGNDQCAILLLKKEQSPVDPPEPETILFINAQALHEDRVDGSPLQKLTKEGIDQILSAYERSIEGEHFSRRVTLDEVRAGANSLDPERYVPTEDGLDYECAALRDLVLDAAWGISSGSVTGERVRVVHARDIDPDGEILSSSIARETVDPTISDGTRLEKGDILISFRGDVPAKIAMYEGGSTTLYPGHEFLRLRPDPRKVLAPYLLGMLRILKDTQFRNSDRDSLFEDVLSLVVVIPPHSRQAQIWQTLRNNPGMQSFITGILTTANRKSEE